MKKPFYSILILLFLFSQTICLGLTLTPSEEIIGTVNGENLYLIEFNRLFAAQKKQFHNNYHFDLFSPPTENPKATLKREEQIKKANKEGLFISNEEFNNALEELITKESGIENIQSKAKANNLSMEDIKNKLEENLLLDKHFENDIKPKLVDLMIEELLLLQEAKAQNIQVPEEEVLKRLNTIKNKQGGEEGFQAFLAENAATLEDAQNEIRKQVAYDLVKNEILKEQVDFEPYLLEKKSNSVIIVYNNKLFPQEEESLEPIAQSPESKDQQTSLRTNPYPTITKSKVEEIKKLEEKTNEIITGLEQKPEVSQQLESSEETKNEMLKALNEENAKFEKKYARNQFKFPSISLHKFIKNLNDKKIPLLDADQIKFLESRRTSQVQDSAEVADNNEQTDAIEKKPEALNILPNEPIEVAKITATTILQPVNVGQKIEDKEPKIKKRIFSKLKDKFNKVKLVKAERKQKTIEQSLVPGEEISIPSPQAEVQATQPQVETLQEQAQVFPTVELPAPTEQPQAIQAVPIKDLSKEFEELRQKIEQRQFASKKQH